MSELLDHLARLGYEENHPGEAVPEGFVAGLEQALGCRLPSDYLEFLAAYPRSGGFPFEACIGLPRDEGGWLGNELCWLELRGHAAKQSNGLVYLNTQFPDQKVEDMIIIGDDSFGNMLYMTVNQPGMGAIYFKDRTKDERMTRAQMVFVRDSFTAFILDTYEKPEELFD